MPSRAPRPFRLLLVELTPDVPERQFRVQAYPVLLGLAGSLGWKASWCALGVRADATLRYALPPGDLALLRGELARLRPRVVVLNERLREEQWERLAAGGGRLVYCDMEGGLRRFADFVRRDIPEARGPWLDDPRLLDAIEPDFRRRVLNRAPWARRPLIRIFAGGRCCYRTRAADNPFYRGLGLPEPTLGCSFCGVPDSPRLVEDPVAFAVRHLAAACRQPRPRGAERRFELIGFELWRRLEDLARALARSPVRGAELSFMPRIDELLQARGAIARSLPLLARRDLALRVYGMGVENFSAVENRRLNKGVSARQVHEAAAFIQQAAARWPGRFRFQPSSLSMILFTPWTTLGDLRVNAEHMGRCPLIQPAAALGTRLQLFPGRPITVLAEKDGLLAGGRGGPSYNSGCIVQAGQGEVPWRFAHPEVALLWRLGRRLSTNRSGLPADDPDSRDLAAFLSSWPESGRAPLAVFRAALAAARRRPGTVSLAGLLRLLRPRL